jgi:methylmalonyl-CoA carboxyltransferase 12S subunit
MSVETTRPPQTIDEKIKELHAERARLELGGGRAGIERQHANGKLTARERIARLIDDGTFQEIGLFAKHQCCHFGMADKEMPGDGVVTGSGAVAGRIVHVAGQDFTVAGGAAGEAHCVKIAEAQALSLKTGSPFIFFSDSGGARVQEGVDSLHGHGQIFYQNVQLSGVVPQISLICGPCVGGAAYSAALTDFIIQTRQAQVFLAGPQLIKLVSGEEASAEVLGGVETQMSAGLVHFIAADDKDAIDMCRRLLSFLPQNNRENPPRLPFDGSLEPDPELNHLAPVDTKRPYDVRTILIKIVDYCDFLELQPHFAPNLVTGFARIQGRPVGLVANQPCVLGGALDIYAADKAARFVRFCNAFNFPLVSLVDVPGFLPGLDQENGGIIRRGAKMLFAYSAATVPKITVITRKAYGGAYFAMGSKELGADRVIAWPTAEVAVMGAEGAAETVFRREIERAPDPVARRGELIRQYRDIFCNPYLSASRRMVDDIIEPAETRRYLALALDSLLSKREVRPREQPGLVNPWAWQGRVFTHR